ncbi:MAG: hypothetical protein RL375_3116 [Pseudomonadota bacterium]
MASSTPASTNHHDIRSPPATAARHRTVRPKIPAPLLPWFVALLALVLALGARPAMALELTRLTAERGEQGVLLNFETRFELPASVLDALHKGVALHFVADARLLRGRWYWRDQRVSQVTRSWRLSYQALTFSYRVSQGGLSQGFASLDDALRALQRASRWRIADALAPDDDSHYYIEFNYRLDASQLPRPLQIGLGAQPEWNLQVEHSFVLPPEPAARRE